MLPKDAAARKRIPVYSGFMAYFPRAICEVAKISFEGNEQHHPGTPLHWDMSKSTDEADAMCRHLLEGAVDPQTSILAQTAWRAMARLERHMLRLEADVAHRPPLATSADTSTHPMMAETLREADEPYVCGYAAEVAEARRGADGRKYTL